MPEGKICYLTRTVLAMLLSGFGKSFIYQYSDFLHDFVISGFDLVRQGSAALIVSHLSAVARGQLNKLEPFFTSAFCKENEDKQKVTIPKNLHV